MNHLEEAFYYMGIALAQKEGTIDPPENPFVADIWKNEKDELRVWTGNEWMYMLPKDEK